MKRIVKDNIKREKHENSVKNVMLMSSKSISSNIKPIVNRKGNRLYDIFAMKEAFSIFFYFDYRVFLLTVDLF